MSSDYITKDIVYVNSAYRVSGTSNNFTIDLSSQISYPNNYDRVALLAFSCPKSYYLINDTNDNFVISEPSPANSKTIVLTHGNYSLTSIVAHLNSIIAAAGLNYTYTITKDTSLGKITITVSSNSGNQPSFIFSDSSPYGILGFNKTTYTTVANVLTSPNVVNLQLTNTIQLMSNIADKSLLSTIIPDTSDFSIILYNEQNASFASKKCLLKNVSSASFWLLDGNNGKPLDLNGLNYNFKFVIYKQNDYYRKALNEITIRNALSDLQNG